MKKLYLILMSLIIGLMTFAQKVPQKLTDIMLPYYSDSRNIEIPFYLQPNNTVHSPAAFNETVIGTTFWDLQSSNSAPPNRFYVYPDGKMAAVWTMGMDTENNYEDRGTGYAFFNGTTWDTMPTSRLETERAGWPSYAPAGNGEIIAAHHNSMGIIINYRTTLGTGEWTEYLLENPTSDSAIYLSWPRLVSSGEDKMMVHMLVNTYEPYQNLDPAILYYRSTDGGQTWETQARIIEGMTSNEYYGLNTETYSWAEPKDSMLAFVVADRWNDLFIMKSNDNGDTWQKTVVWEHPYPMWNNQVTDTFYSPDGAASLAFDNDGKLHLAFGVNRTVFMEDTTGNTPGIMGWYPFVDGIAYWNEDMPVWSGGDMEALNPDNLEQSGNLAGMMQDLDDNGEVDLIGTNYQNLGLYYVGLSSMPQLTIDDQNRIFLVYSGVAEGFDDGTQMYRHLWARVSLDGGTTWGNYLDLTGDVAQNMNESVFPTLAPWSDENLHLIYQSDQEPGLSTLGDMDAPAENSIIYLEVPKSVLVSTNDVPTPGFRISQNYPNPFTDYTSFKLEVDKSSTVALRIYDLTGRLVMQIPERAYNAGEYIIPLNVKNITRGMYTYTFIVNGNTISNKMIVK
ncbi:MAG TPA: T9SS type A sorting domain-containing protein [Lentimicrobium sp.]|nr:T9SS type A sorting domain-containing protein [Lentimicrobium sp.]